MSMLMSVSFKKTEKELFNWASENQQKISFSDICKTALRDKKKELEEELDMDQNTLLRRIAGLQKTILDQSDFIEGKGLHSEWLEKNGIIVPQENKVKND